ncbi:phytanoyl-CoA dioxygenase family protein [Pseudoteredinibacter isoporae]|uniref:Ectoine hydroxylase-related dioxygenase (Phytanoyl-CoA dioxygenase family) n=1 Tax=Pseudoteredinibacter isoporae TaxID=570281 RepID=A0A7X0MWS4_9GAMM|nr:phytanoyl-CoA dioxygenase family protein [Pseudoteredinibacter isoporae]MBB6522495.1 ectoine hydroxylase-related dioxygenase (phytanoyl-CoA dioxygenase family) [Pseudoteredinibacter isoporae]NHO88024.1 phytanoyl-CoA dioxygenase family protein [Pseudoteredinibacter isoporae]NIB23645.1 phytanoyl-CoA dioxygenase family protein [Pseudoteredinibacter isoporae]
MSDDRSLNAYHALETASKYKKTQSNASDQVDPEVFQQYLSKVLEEGYVVIPDLLSQEEIDQIRHEVEPMLSHRGRNFFEGELTQRIYSVMAKTFALNPMVEHPMILALLDAVLMPSYLLSQLQVINILPGEKQQPLHADDGYVQIPRPRRFVSAATVWAIDDFTEENGGTAVIPGSHHWGDKQPDEEDKKRQINCEMKAGSAVFFLGTLWHGGGANVSEKPRLAATAQYCEGFIRPQENFSLSVPLERAAQCSEDIKRMLGYSIFGPFMGMVDGKHPKRLLEPYLEKDPT